MPTISEYQSRAESFALAAEVTSADRLAEIEARYTELFERMVESTPAPAGATWAEREEADKRRQESWGLTALRDALEGHRGGRDARPDSTDQPTLTLEVTHRVEGEHLAEACQRYVTAEARRLGLADIMISTTYQAGSSASDDTNAFGWVEVSIAPIGQPGGQVVGHLEAEARNAVLATDAEATIWGTDTAMSG